MNLYSPVISGSLTVTGSTSFIGNVTMTGTVSATASNATLLDGTGSVGFTTTGSFTTMSGSVSSRVSQIETVYATTGSNSFRATQSITGSLTVTGQIIAQTLNVQQVTSSIVYSSGSNVFGCDLNSRQTFTGSFFQTGSVACFSNILFGNIVTGNTVSAGSPTNSRIVANANQMYGYYDTEANYRWSLGRDVWAGGAAGLAFGVGAGGTCYAIIGDPSGFGCTIGFSILVPNGCSGTIYEKMRITTGGVLIGKTSSTGGKLQVSNGTDMFNVDHDANGPYISAVNNANTVYKRMTYDASEHVFNISAASRVYITSGGLIGVNTASPFNFGTNSGMIDVRSQNTSAVSGVFISNSDATARLTAYINNAATATVGTSTSHALQLVTVDTERARIQTNGFFGIATSSPKAVFDVACGAAHSIISTWCKGANNNTMYNGFDIYMDESSFSGQLYVQANGGGIGVQAVYDVLASYDRLCVILRNSMNRGNGECLTIPSYFYQAGAKRICIQQNNGAGAQMNISAMLIGTAYGGSYICAQA
jgi:uncharacterized protein YaaQ